MTRLRLLISTIFILAPMCLSFIGCSRQKGGIIRYKKSGEGLSLPQSGNGSLFAGEKVECVDESDCSEAIAKTIVKASFGRYNSCASFLVRSDVIATSASCLPPSLRKEGVSCEDEIINVFPKTATRASEKIECEKVLSVSKIRGSDPSLWSRNFAFLKLKSSTKRQPLQISRSGIESNETFVSWKLKNVAIQDPNELGGQKIITLISKVLCQSLHNTYINPLLRSSSSPTLIVSGCESNENSTGSPLVDQNGNVKGLVSIGLSKEVRDSIKERFRLSKIAPINYITNFKCIPRLESNDGSLDSECLRTFSPDEIASAKIEFMSNSAAHLEVCDHIKEVAEDDRVNASGVLRFEVDTNDILDDDNSKEPNIYHCTDDQGNVFGKYDASIGLLKFFFKPICFTNAANWRDSDLVRGKWRTWKRPAKFELMYPLIRAGVTLDEKLQMKKVWEEVLDENSDYLKYEWKFRPKPLLKGLNYLKKGSTKVWLKMSEVKRRPDPNHDYEWPGIKHCGQ